MDRLETIEKTQQKISDFLYLYSSMDRLETVKSIDY